MSRQIEAKSVGLRVAFYFARNHDEHLTTADLCIKFEVPADQVYGRLERWVANQMLTREATGAGRGRQATYSAGPALLLMIGERRAVPDRRAEDRGTPDRRVEAQGMALQPMACAGGGV